MKTLHRVLIVDMSAQSFIVEERPDLFSDFIGGSGVSSALLREYRGRSPEGPIVFAVGPFTALYPMASKTVASFLSPLTGNYGESHAGGRSAVSLRMAGYGALVVLGQAPFPQYLVVDEEGARFKDARSLWGMKNCSTPARIMREQEGGAGLRSILRIGPAGEKKVSYASVTTETYRHFGRMGLGAVFGMKKLKGIVLKGNRGIRVSDPARYKTLYQELYKEMTESDIMKKYHDLGTPANILPLHEMGALPVCNLTRKSLTGPEADSLSGEKMAARFLSRRLACAHCPVACIHLAALRLEAPSEPYFYQTSYVSYDYELLYALGSMIGVTEARDVLRLIDRVEQYGMDAMSTGVILAWITEAGAKGLLPPGAFVKNPPSWGQTEAYLDLIDKICFAPSPFFETARKGCAALAEVYGGKDFALVFGKNEMPGYHTGIGAHLGFLLGIRHSHLDNAGYALDQKMDKEVFSSPDHLALTLIKEESFRHILSSLVVCFFARNIYSPSLISELSRAAGFSLPESLLEKGLELYRAKLSLKEELGFRWEDLSLPRRVCETQTPGPQPDQAFARETLRAARRLLQDTPATLFEE
ncbi:aldehyde:ferredoxin oxidoreductase [Candidatus Mcinerneyibacteriota bacterium]|nr:aldehyde:ferredoxin oxidoreductase [Candidatus Mcinerneyibacteriota bacterium]